MTRRPAALLTLLLLAGCTDTAPERPSAQASPAVSATSACTDGVTAFGKLTTTPTLTDVTPVVEITARAGGPLNQPAESITAPVAGVTGDPGVPAQVVYQALQDQKFEDTALVELGTVHKANTTDKLTINGPGKFVRYEYVQLVRAPFTWTCGGVMSTGTVTTWANGGNTGTLDCAEPDRAASGLSREVVELRC